VPIIKSAIKRARQSLARRSRNLQTKRAIHRDVAALNSSLTSGDSSAIQEKLSAAYSEIDRAVKKGTLHKNTAARRKSKLAHEVAKASGVEATPAEVKTTKGTGKKASTTKTATKKTPAKAKAPAAAKKPAAKATSKAPAKKTEPKKTESK
jgi:small subunit ribosomal protein S20